jgi:capsular polysaccharide transport system permease protein
MHLAGHLMSDMPADTDPIEPRLEPLRRPARARRFKSARTIGALIMREMQTTYGRSAGGYAWALLEPIGGIALFAFILSTGFRIRTPPLGDNFPLFLASGLLLLGLFMQISTRTAQSINFSKPLLFYPAVRYTDPIIARFLLNFLTQLLVIYIIVYGILLIYDMRVIFNMPQIALAVGLTGLLALGIGTLNCFLFSLYPILQNVWSIVTRPLVLVSTIFFTFENIPRGYQDIAWWNPLVHVIGLMRRGFYASYEADWASPFYVGLVGGGSLVVGLALLHRYHRKLLQL